MIQTRLSASSALAAATLATLAAGPAAAHTGIGNAAGFVAGFAHPLFGIDHLLAMVAVGMFAALLGGRAQWGVPTAFVGMMLVGGALGFSGVDVPAVETMIALSVVTLGLVVALGWSWPIAAALALVGVFAVFHGHAHGAEMNPVHGAVLYSAGFALATALLHGVGLVIGLSPRVKPMMLRGAGALIAIAGLLLAAN